MVDKVKVISAKHHFSISWIVVSLVHRACAGGRLWAGHINSMRENYNKNNVLLLYEFCGCLFLWGSKFLKIKTLRKAHSCLLCRHSNGSIVLFSVIVLEREEKLESDRARGAVWRVLAAQRRQFFFFLPQKLEKNEVLVRQRGKKERREAAVTVEGDI